MKSKDRRAPLALPFLLAAAVAASGCSFLLDFEECTSNADCAPLAGTGESLVCGPEHRCIARAECSSDADCTAKAPRTQCSVGACVEPPSDVVGDDVLDAQDSAQDEVSDVPVRCTTHSECIEVSGSDGICSVDGWCVNAITDECHTVVFPQGERDRVVFIGSIIPTSAPFDAIGVPLERAVQLAIEDFNRAGGLPGGRKLVWVACDSRGSSETAQRAARHLVGVVGTPAIVGPVFSTPFIDVTTNVTAPAGVFTISPTATAPSITDLDDGGLAWRVIASDVFQGNAIVDRIKDLGVARAVLLAKDDAYGNGLLAVMVPRLVDPVDGLGADGVFQVYYADPATLPDVGAITDEFAARASAAVQAMPDAQVVAIIGTTEAIDLYKIYRMALQSAGITATPTFLFSHGAVTVMDRAVSETVDAMIAYVEGISPNIFDETNYAAFNLRYRARYNDEDPITSTSLSYDATFVVLFAMSAIERGGDITGDGIATAVARLVDPAGTVVSFGDPTFISKARNALSAAPTATVDLKGVSGELDFDLATGDVRSNYLGWIIEKLSGSYFLKAARVYVLAPEADAGVWSELAP